MGKSICRTPRIEIIHTDEDGTRTPVNITRWFVGVQLNIQLGEINTAMLTLIDDPEVVTITPDDRQRGIPVNDTIVVGGVDISHVTRSHTRRSEVGMRDVIVLELYCDPDVVVINGTTPWVDAGDELARYEVYDNLREARRWMRLRYT